MIRHAGLLVLRLGGVWRGALIEGDSGSGKSDLALRLLDLGFRLCADDRTVIWTSGGALYGRAPRPLKGLIESRGQGILSETAIEFAQVALVCTCRPPQESLERLPDPTRSRLLGMSIPQLSVHAFELSAPAKVRRAMEHLGGGP